MFSIQCVTCLNLSYLKSKDNQEEKGEERRKKEEEREREEKEEEEEEKEEETLEFRAPAQTRPSDMRSNCTRHFEKMYLHKHWV